MTTINRDVLLHLLKLSKLEIPVEKEADYLSSLNNLIEVLSLLQKVNVDSVEMSDRNTPNMITREDIPDTNIEREVYEKQAPKTLSGFYIVPQVIE